MICNFELAWTNPCQNEKPCADHADAKCCVCEKDAIRECSETFGVICGALLCDSCEHLLTSEGVNSIGGHCRKNEQKYLPWFVQDYINEQGLEILDSEGFGYPYITERG